MNLLVILFIVGVVYILWLIVSYKRPYIIENVLTEEEVKYIKNVAEPKLTKSKLISKDNKINESVRNSDTAWLNKNGPKIKEIMDKILSIEDIRYPLENCESLQVVRYKPGGFYKQHHDACCRFSDSCKAHHRRGGYRIRTVILGLNDDYKGGTTSFPKLDAKFKVPYRGALVFRPLNNAGVWCHPFALHAGDPVEHGEKWIANLWIHERKFS